MTGRAARICNCHRSILAMQKPGTSAGCLTSAVWWLHCAVRSDLDYFIRLFREHLTGDTRPQTAFCPRPYRNAAVRFRSCVFGDFAGRLKLVQDTGLNVFYFPASMIPGCDLLSDSGTTTMTMEQWAALLLGDEAYGSNEGFFELREQIPVSFGDGWRLPPPAPHEHLFLFHQGRAAEYALSSVISGCYPLPAGKESFPSDEAGSRVRLRLERLRRRMGVESSLIVPSNAHFDTTEANFAHQQIAPLNLPCVEHETGRTDFPFRGNIDIEALRITLESAGRNVPLVYLTVTNNTGGGQPVSLENIRKAAELCRHFNKPLFLDACRFAENAWFIKKREPGCSSMTVSEIVHEMFAPVDGFHISFKKDGLANIGGALVVRPDGLFARIRHGELLDRLISHQILSEGHPTYGGLAGRDIRAITEGLRTVVRPQYLSHRIAQVHRFGHSLRAAGIPVMEPFGGHAIYIDIDRFFAGTGATDAEFRGISLTALLLVAGHRLCELGTYAFGSWRNGKEEPPDPRVNNVRAAIPRLAYEDQDLAACASAVRLLFENRDRIPAVRVEYGRELELRHFKSRFSFA